MTAYTFESPYVQKAVTYAQQVVAGDLLGCEWTVKACQRQLDDLAREKSDPDWPYYFDEGAADRVCRFIELLPHVKGEWARRRETISLEAWQCFIETTVFGWLRKADGFRRFQTVYVEVPRKNAKSTLLSGTALYMFAADGEAGAGCYSAATKKDQAKIVFGAARMMAKKSSEFRARFGIHVYANSLKVLADDSVFEPLDAEGSTQDGLNISFCGNDEVHAWKTRTLYDVIETATGSRAQPLIWNITTSGSNQGGICYSLRGYLLKVLNGIATDETFFGIIYSIDKGDDWRDESSWHKANPNLGVSVYLEDMRRGANKAEQNPSDLNNFLTKRLDVWVNANSPWMDMTAWDACADPALRLEDFEGEACHLGLDLASKKDLASAVKIFERGEDLYLFCRNYLPEKAVRDARVAEYPGWVKEGWIIKTAGPVTDYDWIETDILEDGDRFDMTEVDYDPHQATQLVGHLLDAGVTCVELRPTVLNFSEPMKDLEAKVLAGKLHHNGDPVLRWAVSNVVCHTDAKDNIYPRKEQEDNKIDPVVAAITARSRQMRGEDDGEPEVKQGFVAL